MRRRRSSPISTASAQERIRVVFIIPTMIRGGAERQLLLLLRGLDRSRFDPTLVLFSNKDQNGWYETSGAVDRVLSLDIPPGGNFRAQNVPTLALGVMRLARILRDIRPHIVHAFLSAPAVIGSLACRLTGVPAFIVGRRAMAGWHRRGSAILTWFDRLPLRFAAGLVGNCKAIAEEAVVLDGLTPERAFTIYNGVDLNVFHTGRDEALRRDLRFARDDVVFGVVANFHHVKRHTDFVRAAEEIRKSAQHAKFLMVGTDQGTLADLRTEIHERSLDPCFAVVTGTTEPERYYRAMDVYVCSSALEGMSNSIMEAMASALPVIATVVGGNSELVTSGETGFLVSPYAPPEIASRALSLITQNDLRVRMGDRALRTVEERFSVAAMVRAHEELYSSVMSKCSTSA